MCAFATERNDLNERRPTLDCVHPVRCSWEKREVDQRLVGIRIDHARDHLKYWVVTVERGHEQAAPARRRDNGPIVVKLARRPGLARIASNLMHGVIGHHCPVDFPTGVHRLAVVLNFKSNRSGHWDHPTRRQRI